MTFNESDSCVARMLTNGKIAGGVIQAFDSREKHSTNASHLEGVS